MKLTCPSCGATASAEAWENDVEARKTIQAIIALPREVAIVATCALMVGVKVAEAVRMIAGWL